MAARPLFVSAQQPGKIARIGYLGFGSASAYANLVEGLRTGLGDLGYVEGKDIVIEFRWANAVQEMPKHAAELVGVNVDMIFAASSTYVAAARRATKVIPIVFAVHADPVGVGDVDSLARPGGNYHRAFDANERARWQGVSAFEGSPPTGSPHRSSLGCHHTPPTLLH
jgi:putative tryptophan/tyrosine transport system substrate-binding protein